MEKRRFPRIYTDAPIKCRACLSETGESWSEKGIMKNISLGGVYIRGKPPPLLKLGDIQEFTITTVPGPYFDYISRFSARGKVVRTEPPELGSPDCGIAIQFLTPPEIDSPKG
jgi:hypothetical protein